MADTTRNQRKGEQQQGSQDPPRRQNAPKEPQRNPSDQREEVAHDRGRDNAEPRGFNSEREADELGSEPARETGISTEDDEDVNSPSRGRSDR